MSDPQRKVVTLLPVPLFLLELHSERLVDIMHVLHDSGFSIKQVTGFENRYRIDDTKELSE